MTASFAAYASQFLNRQQSGLSGAASSLSSSQPIFFSFTTDNGSHAGNGHETDLDDLDDPHLRSSEYMSRQTATSSRRGDEEMALGGDHDDDDPYLRLDEEDPGTSRHQSFSVPLLAVSGDDGGKGWLAHASPLRSPSPSPSELSEESDLPPRSIPSLPMTPPQPSQHLQPPPRTQPTLSLTESLLPRDGRTRPVDVFSLPDPRHTPRSRRKFNDSRWTAVWCAGLSICLFSCILVLFLTRNPTKKPPFALPYTVLLHTVPLLTILICLSAIVSYTHIFLLRIFVKPVMIATSVFIPATLLISALWAFIGSFMWDGDTEPTWGETWGLRLFSLIPLALCLLTARRLVDLPREIHTASSLLTLTTRLLMLNPFLLALSPAVLLTALLASIPFITLAFRLLLIGNWSHPHGNASGWEWHVREWANWAIAATIAIWLWTWGVARGLLRVTCAGVIGAWYFADPTMPSPPPTSTHTIHAALTRATQPSLGTIVLSALILTGIRLLGLLTMGLRALPAYLPPYMRFVSVGAGMAVGYLENITGTLSTYALVYTGLTGDPFMPSARRSRALTGAVESQSLARYRKRFKTEPPLTMLTVAPLTLTFPFALGTYIFVSHTLGAPHYALSASLLAGGVTALVGLFCVGLVKDTADTLYLCYCIDKDTGVRRREEVFAAFEYESSSRRSARTQQTPSPSSPQPSRQDAVSVHKPNAERPLLAPPDQPRRTTQLVSPPPPRETTPDPFEDSPLDPYSPPTSSGPQHRTPIASRSHITESMRMSNMKRSSPLPGSESEGEGDESQLFPGSDLF
ncbi:hypothetical protein K474DRAFT_1657661 [Panus rudis PR-1116 ss-1]|nr:hypothetical protein K474DRAFT_1657661 [Panus rudis PR-1116 ss-1]